MSWTVSEPVPQVDTVEVLRDALDRAAAAHGADDAESLRGERDKAWPQWYAEHIASTLAGDGYTIVRTAS